MRLPRRARARRSPSRPQRVSWGLVVQVGVATVVVGAGAVIIATADGTPPPSRRVALDLPISTTTSTTAVPIEDPAHSGVAPAIATSDALLASHRSAPVDPPVRITVTRAGGGPAVADSAVDTVGLDEVGDVAVPADIRRAGWYGYGSAPGAAGSAVIVAHVDFDGREGPFYRLGSVVPGDTVTITTASGATQRFTVTQRGQYGKAMLPTAALFRTDGDPQLVLITCGGAFRPSARSYADNVVVIATPDP